MKIRALFCKLYMINALGDMDADLVEAVAQSGFIRGPVFGDLPCYIIIRSLIIKIQRAVIILKHRSDR